MKKHPSVSMSSGPLDRHKDRDPRHERDRDPHHERDRDREDFAEASGAHDDEGHHDEERRQTSAGRKLSKDDLQDLAKMSSDLVRRTLLSGIDIVRDVGKELPKEATQFLAARREQVLQNVSKDVIQLLINSSIDRIFKTIREHRVDVSFRIVRDTPKDDESEGRRRPDRGNKPRHKRS